MGFTFEQLEAYRMKSDDKADELVAGLYQQLSGSDVWKLYQQLINDLGELNYQDLPSPLQSYFRENQQLPVWANPGMISRAEQLFLEIGPVYSGCLLLRALPVGYTSMKTVKVLTSTGYLSTDVKQGTAKRLLETTQFIFNVMDEGTFTPNSKGIKHILKVRFLHAIIRYHLQKHGWANEKYGIPINQEDMAGTILTFSVGAIKGLHLVGVKLSRPDKDALVHYWAIIGTIIGVCENLLPTDFEAAENLYEKILGHQAIKSVDGEQLTKALCNFVRGFLPVKYLPRFPEHILDYLIDAPRYSEIVGVEPPYAITDKLYFLSIVKALKFLNRKRSNLIIAAFAKRMNNIFAINLVRYFHREFEMKLTIPEKIKTSWGLSSRG